MTLHLVKLAVGVESVDHLAAIQAGRLRREGHLWHVTRQTPRRGAELLDGGSTYWVIRRAIRVRQRLVGLEQFVDGEGISRCALVLDPELVRTEQWPRKAFQGWRYLDAADAPPDARGAAAGTDELPPAMAEELRELGLL